MRIRGTSERVCKLPAAERYWTGEFVLSVDELVRRGQEARAKESDSLERIPSFVRIGASTVKRAAAVARDAGEPQRESWMLACSRDEEGARPTMKGWWLAAVVVGIVHVRVPPEGATVTLRIAHDWWPW